ncbi:MAG: type II toxin-antitoxin system VapC family toxin [Pseudomonadota bacterium]|nr:type II toxin-antitoxin system VapC family toxin [Pseudomonadota bacterium]
MKYLLDTNICVYAMNGHMPVMRAMRQAGQDALCISAVVLGELAFGVARSAPTHRARNAAHLQQFTNALTVLPWSAQAAMHFGSERQRLRSAGAPIGEMDLLIGCHALAEGLTLVTHNTREFARIDGLTLENWVENLAA